MDLATVVLRLRTDRCDLAVVDFLARLRVDATRVGYAMTVTDVADDLAELLDLAGLSVEVLGEPEQGEEAPVHEGVLGDDAPA